MCVYVYTNIYIYNQTSIGPLRQKSYSVYSQAFWTTKIIPIFAIEDALFGRVIDRGSEPKDHLRLQYWTSNNSAVQWVVMDGDVAGEGDKEVTGHILRKDIFWSDLFLYKHLVC